MYNSIWYNNLTKPLFAPPDWLFAPVWMVLYVLIFAALVFYFLQKTENKESGYLFFGIQLFLNIIWSPIFFMAKNIAGAFFVIILLDIFVVLTLIKFYSVKKIAGILLVPYLIWILFATYLNGGYLFLN
ncbi:tryptophan-rich sensory protein [bacterium]|nr:tryptophan-rich sensory protein [bacterium]